MSATFSNGNALGAFESDETAATSSSPPEPVYDEADDYDLSAYDKLTANDFLYLRHAQKFAQSLKTPEKRTRFWQGNRWQKTPQPKPKKPKSPKPPPPEPPSTPQPGASPSPQANPSADAAKAPNLAAIREHMEWHAAPAREQYPDALIEIAIDYGRDGNPNSARQFGIDAAGLDAAVKYAANRNARGHNIWIGVTLKKPDTPREARTNAEQAYVCTAIPVDIDENAEAVNAILDKVATAGLVVTTGNIPELRQQKWYRLSGVCADMPLVKHSFESVVESCGGDTNATGLHRLMRLAGGVSHPPPKKMVRGYVVEQTTLATNAEAPPVDIAIFAALTPREEKPEPAPIVNENGEIEFGDNFWLNVNSAALANLSKWVPAIFGTSARYQRGTGAYRVSSKALQRDLQEGLSMSPKGIVDFGVADMGDPREGKRTAIDIVLNYCDDFPNCSSEEDDEQTPTSEMARAALWLCKRLGYDPRDLGWCGDIPDDKEEPEPGTPPPDPEPATPPPDLVAIDPWAEFPTPPFPLDVLDDELRQYVLTISELTGCDTGAIAISALAALSSAITHEMKLQMNRHDASFVVSPALRALLFGDPSKRKTPIFNHVKKPLLKYQDVALSRYKQQKQWWEEAPDEERGPEPLLPIRHVINDATIESLSEILSREPRGLLVERDELSGWLENMERYGKGSDRAAWLKARDGGSHSVDRVTGGRTNYVKNFSVSLLGGIQPEKLAEKKGLCSDGLLQRFIPVVMGEMQPSKDLPTDAVIKRYESRVHDCLQASPTTVQMTDGAIKIMHELRAFLERLSVIAGAISPGFQSFVGKLVGVSGNLMLILHIIEDPLSNPFRRVSVETAHKVDRLIREFILPHGEVFYQGVDGAENLERTRSIAGYILTAGKTRFTPSDFTNNVRKLRGLTTFDLMRAISPLVAGGWLDQQDEGRNYSTWTLRKGVAEQMEPRRVEVEARNRALGRPRNATARATAKEIRAMILRKGKPVLRAVIARAKAGDIACAKAIFDLTLPRGRVLCVALPKVRDSASAAEMLTVLLDHVGEGCVTPAEANSLSAVVERYTKVAAMARLETRVEAVEKRVGGLAPNGDASRSRTTRAQARSAGGRCRRRHALHQARQRNAWPRRSAAVSRREAQSATGFCSDRHARVSRRGRTSEGDDRSSRSRRACRRRGADHATAQDPSCPRRQRLAQQPPYAPRDPRLAHLRRRLHDQRQKPVPLIAGKICKPATPTKESRPRKFAQ